MIRTKQISGWAILVAVVTLLLLFISQAGAQDETAVGEPPQSLMMVQDSGEQNTAVANSVNSQHSTPLGTGIIPRAYLPLVLYDEPCPLNAQAQTLASLAMNDSQQQRTQMICDPILSQVAYEKALDMGTRNYFGHTNPDGLGPNFLVEQAGYALPSWYSQGATANNIESIAAGYSTPAAAWAGWKVSPTGHPAHVLGLDSFWRDQIYYGIGYAYVPGSTYGHYWVFITAP